MIVRDEQDNLPNCLSSVAGLFDECPRDPEAMTMVGRPGPTGTAW